MIYVYAILGTALYLAVLGISISAYQRRGRATHSVHRSLSYGGELTVPDWYTQKKVTLTLPSGLYREDVDLADAIEEIERMGREIMMDDALIDEMVTRVQEQVDKLPPKPPEKNDVCPECGDLFAMTDDYLCPACRKVS